MSRFLTQNKDGTYLEEIESMDICRWRIEEVCCNDKSDCLGDFPYPREICYEDNYAERCQYFEKEDGIIKGKEK